MIYSDKEDIKITIPCDCGSEEMEICKFGDNEINYYITFKICSFYAGQSVMEIIKRRLKFAWLALRKGNYIHQEILVDKEKLIELRDNLNEMLDYGGK